MTQEKYLERFKEVTEYLTKLTESKNSDYAGAGNAFQNFNLIEIITSGRISTTAGILVRITDKVQRVANLLAKPPSVVGEAIEDSLLDLAVYSIIEFIWLTANKETLPLPEIKAPSTIPYLKDEKVVEEVYEELPEGASPNTMDEAFEALSKKLLEGKTLTPWESLSMKMIIQAKENLLTEATAGAE